MVRGYFHVWRRSSVMLRLYLAAELRSAAELTREEKLPTVENKRGCSPTCGNLCSAQRARRAVHQPRLEASAQLHGRTMVDITLGVVFVVSASGGRI